MIPLNFIFCGAFTTERHREKCYCQAVINDFGAVPRESMGVRILTNDYEFSPLLDADIFSEYYELATKHIEKMKEI